MGKNDVYCILTVGNLAGGSSSSPLLYVTAIRGQTKPQRTSVCQDGGATPSWGFDAEEEFEFELEDRPV